MTGADPSAGPPPIHRAAIDLHHRAQSVLDEAAKAEQGWVRIHAVEALIDLGEGDRMREQFEAEVTKGGSTTPAAGIWRVLARTASTAQQRAVWIALLEQRFLEPENPDPMQALECLCKLGHALSGEALERVRCLSQEQPPPETIIPLWAMWQSGDAAALGRILRNLESIDPVVRRRSAYVLRWMQVRDPAVLSALTRALLAEPPGTDTYAFILSSALQLDASPDLSAHFGSELEAVLYRGSISARYEACQGLMARCTLDDLPRFQIFLDSPEGDVRIGAAWLILHVTRIARRE